MILFSIDFVGFLIPPLFYVLYFNTFHWIALRWIDLNVYLRKEFSRVIWRQGYNTLHWIALHWIDLIECLSQKRVLTGYLEGPLFSSVIIFQYTTLDRLFIWRHHYSVVWFENSQWREALSGFLRKRVVICYLEGPLFCGVDTFHWKALHWIDLSGYLRKELPVISRHGYNTLQWIDLSGYLTCYLEGPLFCGVKEVLPTWNIKCLF